MFEANFQSILVAPLRMFLMGAAGYYFIRRKIIPESALDALNDLLVYLFLPCLIFHDFFTKFSFNTYGNWWIFPLLGLGVSLAGFVIGELISFSLSNKNKKNEFLSLCAFQNSGYIPLLIAGVILNPEDAPQMNMYIFLFLVGFNFLVWSLGVKLISGEARGIVNLKDLYNPPILATIISLVLIFVGIDRGIPSVVMDSLGSFGNCMMPIAVFVVGGSLATIKIKEHRYRNDVFLAVATKLIVFPVIVVMILCFLQMKSMVGLLLVIQAAAPSAVTLNVIARYYQKDETFINQTIFYSHLIGLVTLPIFLIAYQRFAG